MTIQLILVYIIVGIAVAAAFRFLWRILSARHKQDGTKGSSCPGCSGRCHTPTPPKRETKAKDKEA